MAHASQPSTLFHRPIFQVGLTWAWIIGLPLLLIGIIIGAGSDLTLARRWWGEHRYMQAYLEIAVGGLLPVLFTLNDKENLAKYGFARRGLAASAGLSALVVIARYFVSYIQTGQWIEFAPLGALPNFPENLWHAGWGVVANGPLEVFFVAWLITKSDQIFKSERALLSTGFLVTLVLFSLLHILTTQSLLNAIYVFVIWLAFGLIYKFTRNIAGPMLGWTLINGMVWSFVVWVWA
jgi:membrane protease YdiL (CAAX protease family)